MGPVAHAPHLRHAGVWGLWHTGPARWGRWHTHPVPGAADEEAWTRTCWDSGCEIAA